MRIFLFVMLLLAASPAAALQVGDGQYNNTYNDLDLAATQARFNNITTKGAGGGVPVGTIVAWPAASNPEDMENWLECNGQAISASAYPELRSLIGDHVPDLRGLFLRGVGGNSAALGVQQGDEIPELVARVGYYNGTDGVYMITKPYRFTPNLWAGNNESWERSPAPQSVCSTVVDRISGETENRPVNMAVRYLIRALP